VFEPLAPQANRLAKRVKSWHALERDPLSLGRCQRVIAVLYGYASWASLQDAARAGAEPDRGALAVERLKRLGYASDAAEKLMTYLLR